MANQEITINLHQLLPLTLQSLDRLFLRSQKEKAKKLFKEIADGKVIDLGSLTFEDKRLEPIKLRLALDHSEFVGLLTFHLFKVALQQTLQSIAVKLEKKQDLNIFESNDSEEIIFLTPGIIQQDEKINVMVVGVKPSLQAALIKLQFLDPEQFRKSSQGSKGDNVSEETGNVQHTLSD